VVSAAVDAPVLRRSAVSPIFRLRNSPVESDTHSRHSRIHTTGDDIPAPRGGYLFALARTGGSLLPLAAGPGAAK
jgi:hypothetical protein